MAERSIGIHSKPIGGQADKELLFLGFSAADQSYGLGIFTVKQILKIPRIYSIPKVPGFVKGVIDLRGAIIPILDFRERLGLGHVEPTKGRVVVAVLNGSLLGLMVDDVSEVFRATVEQIKATPDVLKEPQMGFIQGMVHTGETMYLILNPTRLLTAKELSTLENHNWSTGR